MRWVMIRTGQGILLMSKINPERMKAGRKVTIMAQRLALACALMHEPDILAVPGSVVIHARRQDHAERFQGIFRWGFQDQFGGSTNVPSGNAILEKNESKYYLGFFTIPITFGTGRATGTMSFSPSVMERPTLSI